MYRNASYKEKFADLEEWIPLLIDSVKKELRNEHLKKDLLFVKKFFPSKNIHKVTTQELAKVYQEVIQKEERGEELAEFITSRWLLKNGEIYEFFEKKLSHIDPDFTKLQEIELSQAQALIQASVEQFGPLQTYLFSVLNSVVFPAESFHQLKVQAKQHTDKQEEDSQKLADQLSADQLRKNFEFEIVRLTDKYEKKLAGLQKKYVNDVEGLKKQVAQLQRKLQEKSF